MSCRPYLYFVFLNISQEVNGVTTYKVKITKKYTKNKSNINEVFLL